MLYKSVILAVAALAGMASAFVPAGVARRAGRGQLHMASTSDFKNGLTLEFDGTPFKIVEFMHVKPGKGSAFVRSKLKNLMNGSVLDKTWRAGEKVDLAQVEKFDMQFTYEDEASNSFMFMDMESFEEVACDAAVLGTKGEFLKDGMEVAGIKWNEKIIDVELPQTMVYKVTQTDPGLKGDRVQGGTKPATIESGATIQVPLFVEQDELIRVDTRDQKYMSRASEE
mmetsp:Transcript_2380/g.7075  ORF Transcript_2380/g.7075 Transcript_2380/m.7075 type:complete len:226 (-) Transcript_2380:57-734(-)